MDKIMQKYESLLLAEQIIREHFEIRETFCSKIIGKVQFFLN
jgi:hypothetical protein